MPLKLNVEVSRKVGLPNYSSLGAACGLEVDLDAGLLVDLEAFHDRVREVYAACHRAVHDELARLGAAPVIPGSVEAIADRFCDGHPPRPGAKAHDQADGPRPPRPATAAQVKAIRALARGRGDAPDGLPCDHDVARPEDLTLADASRLIARLRAVGPALTPR